MQQLVGAQEIGLMLNVGRQRVFQLTQHPSFPAPIEVLAMGKVWRTDDVITWARNNGRAEAVERWEMNQA